MSSIGPELPPHLMKRPESTSQEDEPAIVGPQIPAELLQRQAPAPLSHEPNASNQDDDDDNDDYGPALPPDLAASRSRNASGPSSSSKKLVGPSLRPSYPTTYDRNAQYDSDDSDDDVGPKPLPAGVSHEEVDGVRQFIEKEEKRRKEVEVWSAGKYVTLHL